ncbi:MAG UNVERIFIED_CONTAM: response regulator [Microcystis novacekii LVE1205-3]
MDDFDLVQANVTSLHLVKAGMEVRIVNEPLRCLDSVKQSAPHSILLDMYMPECTGMELAAVIRQMEMYISIPIVFFSETDRDRQSGGSRPGR